MSVVQDLSDRFAQARILFYLPSALAAAVALALAAFVLLTNLRRGINQTLALCMVFFGVWEGSSALVWLYPRFFVGMAMFSVSCALYASTLLKESIRAPWRSLSSHIWRSRYQMILIVVYLVAFTPWLIISGSGFGLTKQMALGPAYWILSGISLIWILYLFGHCIFLLRCGKVSGIARSELSAFVILLGSVLSAGVLNVCFRSAGIWTAARNCHIILLLGMMYFTALAVRREIFDSRDMHKAFISLSIRGLAYIAFAVFIAVLLRAIGVVSGINRLAWSFCLLLAMVAFRFVDRQIRLFIDRRSVSLRLIEAQTDANAFAERAGETGDLHSQFISILRRWADGSPEIFLSDAVFAATWPSVPVPSSLLLLVSEQGWTTPEILDREGTRHKEGLAFMVENQVAALVCCISPSDEKLLAAFKTRDSQRPFVSRELREARELLRTMQFGLGFFRMRQKLRGNDRLNFYAQYAPQFAHELRNGLYCQSMLLQAIADGRTEEVRLADAKVGLERIEQVHRLCDNFFNLGTLFRRPIQIMHLRDAVVAIVNQTRSQFADAAQVQIELSINTPSDLFFLANPDLFEMAVNNLLKNGVEALAGTETERLIEVTAEKHLESVHLLICDNGPGLPNDRKSDPFRPGLSHKRDGLGLGLSIVRDCIEAMGGTIGVRASPVSGTCFEIALRCAETPGEAIPSPGETVAPKRENLALQPGWQADISPE